MVLAVVVSVVALAAVLLAVYVGDEARTDAGDAAPRVVTSPSQVLDVRFPRSWHGYDPVAVERHLAAVADAYAALLDEAPAEVVERARRRVARPQADEEGGVDPPAASPRHGGHPGR